MRLSDTVSHYSSLISFCIGLPTVAATYYQSWRTRREAREARQGLVWSDNCLEFVLENGTGVNLVPLESLHSLPKPGDVVLLPGMGAADGFGAYRVMRVEHIYARVEGRHALSGQARLAKAVAHVERV